MVTVITKYHTSDGHTFNSLEKAQAYADKQNQMKKFYVTLYYSGYVTTVVEATDKAEALDIARKETNYDDIDFEELSFDVDAVEEKDGE